MIVLLLSAVSEKRKINLHSATENGNIFGEGGNGKERGRKSAVNCYELAILGFIGV